MAWPPQAPADFLPPVDALSPMPAPMPEAAPMPMPEAPAALPSLPLDQWGFAPQAQEALGLVEPAPEAPAADAVSGGALPPELEPEQTEEERTKAEADRLTQLAQTDPNAFTDEQVRQQRTRELEEARLRDEALAQDKADALDNQNFVQDAAAQAKADSDRVVAELTELAKTKTDPDGWWHSRTGGQQVSAVFAAMGAGFLNPTGPNSAIQHFEKLMDDNIRAQEIDLVNRRAVLGMKQSVIGDIYARSQDVYQAREAVRLASWQHLDQQIAVEMTKFDPAGATAMMYAKARMDAQGRAAEAARNLEKYEREKKKDELKMALDLRDAARQDRADRRAAAGQSLERMRFKADLAEKGLMVDANGNVVRDPNAPGPVLKPADQKTLMEISPEERERQFGVNEMIDATTGKAVLYSSPEVRAKVAGSQQSTKTAARLIDQLLLARQKYGAEADLLKSPEWRQMKSDFADLKLARKSSDELGVLAGPDMGLIEEALGTSDPTEFRDSMIAGLKNAQRNMVNQFNDKASSLAPPGTKLKPWSPPRLKALDAFEKPKGQNVSEFLAPVPPGLENDPEAIAAVAEDKLSVLPALAREASPAELNSMRAKVDVLEADGVLSKAQASEARKLLERKTAKQKSKERSGEAVLEKAEEQELNPLSGGNVP